MAGTATDLREARPDAGKPGGGFHRSPGLEDGEKRRDESPSKKRPGKKRVSKKNGLTKNTFAQIRQALASVGFVLQTRQQVLEAQITTAEGIRLCAPRTMVSRI